MARKYFDLTNKSDLEEVQRLLQNDDDDDDTSNENFEEESDIDSQDEVEKHESDSETEQECEEFSDDEDEGNEDLGKSFILGKDKQTKWSKNPSVSHLRRVQYHNIITHLLGFKGNAVNAQSAVECWNNLFTDEILDTIVEYTNQYIETLKHQFIRQRDIKPTDAIELRAFISLLYLAGAYKANRQSLEELWGREVDGVEKFSLVMSLRRFKALIRCLRFDDRTTRAQRKTFDRLVPVRKIFEKFVENCRKSYCVGENVTIDEMLPGFRGRCSFRQYIPSKPTKYGIKIYSLVDARMMYTLNLEIYAGKQPTGSFCKSNKPTDVVMRMVEPIFGAGRNISADNWFTSFELVDELKTRKLSYEGTVKINKSALPLDFVNVKGRKQYSSMFGFNNGKVLVSYIPRERKNVILVSSLHDDDAIDPASGEQKKPEGITFYNTTKCGVDTAD